KPDTHWVKTRDGKTLDTHKAKVWLAEIPFVRLRSFLPENTLIHKANFSHVVGLVDILAGNPPISINKTAKTLKIGKTTIKLPDRQLSLYLLLHHYQLQQKELQFAKDEVNTDYSETYLHILASLKGEMGDLDSAKRALKKGMDQKYLQSIKSRFN